MSVLTIIQDHCKLHALAVPGAVVSSTDTTATQLLAILKEVIEEFVTEANFQVVTKEVVFTALAASSQGLLTDLADEGYQSIINESLWDRTNMLPLAGPMNAVQWQKLQVLVNAGPNYSYRIREGELLLWPAPAAPLPEISFEYVSSWVVTDDTGTPKAAITADNDLLLLPEPMIKRGVAARWKHIKGLPYLKDEQKFYSMLNNFLAKDGTKETINVGQRCQSAEPMIVVPSSNWLQ